MMLLLTLLYTILSSKLVLDTYIGAVAHFNHEGGEVVGTFISMIEEAKKKNAEVLAFPECGLYQPHLTDLEYIVEGESPCDHPEYKKTKPLQYALSCSVRENSIYVVVGIREHGEKCKIGTPDCQNGYYIYNSLITFDRTGKIIKHYQKTHITPGEKGTDHPGKGVPTYFDTDFGVRFGIFICYDVFWVNPPQNLIEKYNVRNILYPTHWADSWHPPPTYSNQMQQGFSLIQQVNFLASNNRNISTTSGIYTKGFPIITSQSETSTLLVAEVPKITSKKILKGRSMKNFVDFPKMKEQHTQFFQAKSGYEDTITLNTTSMNCAVTFKVGDNKEEEWFMVEVRQDQYDTDFFYQRCGIFDCGATKDKCEDFGKFKTKTKFEKIEVRTTFLDDDLNMVIPLMSTNDKVNFKVGEYEFKKVSEKEYLIKKNSSSVDYEDVLFVYNFGVLKN